MWNDIDLYHAVRDFTSDPVSFPADEMRSFIRELVRHRWDQLYGLGFNFPTGVQQSALYSDRGRSGSKTNQLH